MYKLSVKIQEIRFDLAKVFYNFYHRTNKAPAMAMRNYVALEGDDWEFLGHMDLLFDDPAQAIKLNDKYSGYLGIFLNDRGDWTVYTKGKFLGILSINVPSSPKLNNQNIYELTRICFPDYFEMKTNKQKKYPSKFVRECLKMFQEEYEVNKFITYLHENQNGRYLQYAGFQIDHITKHSKNSKGWSNRAGRSQGNLSNKVRFTKKNEA